MVYPGGKNGSGIYQKLINLMPKHDVYVEPFLGSGALLKYKKPARLHNIAIDVDATAISSFGMFKNEPNFSFVVGCALAWLEDMEKNLYRILGVRGLGTDPLYAPSVLIYLDPPYLMGTRSSHRPIYRYELEDDDHRRLLDIIRELRCMVMISGYPSDMYDQALRGWRRITYRSMTRGGTFATEVVWINFPEPFELHDYKFLGSNFRERERIKRKIKRWQERIARMDTLERAALLLALERARSGASPNMTLLQSMPADDVFCAGSIAEIADGIQHL